MTTNEKFFWVIQNDAQEEFERYVVIGTVDDLLRRCHTIYVWPKEKPLQCWDSTFTYRRDMVKEALKSVTLYTPPTERTLRSEQDAAYREMLEQMTEAERRDHQKLMG